MRVLTSCAALLLGATLACADDPTGAPVSRSAHVSAAAATDPVSKMNPLPSALERQAQSVQADLEANGYVVARGYWTLWSTEQCMFPIHSIGNCWGNNPTAPYVLAVVPQWKDEYVDQSLHHALLQAQRNMSATYRLDPREALVVLAELPPPARYFGMQTNVFTREAPLNTNDPIYNLPFLDSQMRNILFGAAPDPSRRFMVASIGNSTNNVVIERRTNESWQAGQRRYFVITSDATVADSMSAALIRAGVPTLNDIFTEPVAQDLVRIGLGRPSDDLITYIRYAMPNDSAAGEQWRQELPLTVLRVRDTSSSRVETRRPFAVPAYDQRTANFDETTLAPDLGALAAAVRAHWNQPAAPLAPYISTFKVLDLVGQHCLGYPSGLNRGPMDCIGDGQDADYQIGSSVTIDSGQVIAAIGTLATRTGNATYVSLSVNWFPFLVGVANISDTQLDGTAGPFASVLHGNADKFYVYYLARDCTGLQPCMEISRKQVPVGATLKLIQRNYVSPGSARGPDPNKMLNPVTIILDGRNRPK